MTLDYRTCIQFFFPPSDNEVVLNEHSLKQFMSQYNPTTYRSITSLLPYRIPVVKAAVQLNKYHYHAQAQQYLAHCLSSYLHTRLDSTLILPIPLSRKRLRTRGYNQVAEILTRASMPSHASTSTTLLTRRSDTTPQTSLTREARLHNMRNAFYVPSRGAKHIAGAHILIIDDVVTTGATLRAAEAAVEQHNPASVQLLALAH